MKKFLSILLAVMMVLSTVSFAAPSLAGTADTAVEAPVAEVPVFEEETADLAATAGDESTYGKLIFNIDFENFNVGDVMLDHQYLDQILEADDYDSEFVKDTYYLNWEVGANEIVEVDGNKFIKGGQGWSQVRIENLKYGYGAPEGVYTFVMDAIDYGSTQRVMNAITQKCWIQSVEVNSGIVPTQLVAWEGKLGEWQTIAAEWDGVSNNMSWYFTDGATTEVGFDNIKVYYRPATVKLTIAGEEYEVSTDAPVSVASLASQVKAPTGYVLSGLSLTEGGELLTGEQYYFEDTTLYATFAKDPNIDPTYGKALFVVDFENEVAQNWWGHSYHDNSVCSAGGWIYEVASYYDSRFEGKNYRIRFLINEGENIDQKTVADEDGNHYTQGKAVSKWPQILVPNWGDVQGDAGIYTFVVDTMTDTAVENFAYNTAWTAVDPFSKEVGVWDTVAIQQTMSEAGKLVSGEPIVNYSFTAAGATISFDNAKLFYKPLTADVTLIYKGEEYVAADVATSGVSADTIVAASGLEIPYGKKAVLSATNGGESVGNTINLVMDSTYYVSFVDDDSISEYGKRLLLIDFENFEAGDVLPDKAAITQSTSNYNGDWSHLTINYEVNGNDTPAGTINRIVDEDGNKIVKGTQGWAQIRINNANYESAPEGYYTMALKVKNYGDDEKYLSTKDQNSGTKATWVKGGSVVGTSNNYPIVNGEWNEVASQLDFASQDFTIYHTDAMTTDVAFDDIALYYRPASVNLTVVDVDGEETVYENCDSVVDIDTLLADVVAPFGYKAALSIEKDGEPITGSINLVSDAKLYVVLTEDETVSFDYGKALFIVDLEREDAIGWWGLSEDVANTSSQHGAYVSEVASYYDSRFEGVNYRIRLIANENPRVDQDMVVDENGNHYVTGSNTTQYSQVANSNYGNVQGEAGTYTYMFDVMLGEGSESKVIGSAKTQLQANTGATGVWETVISQEVLEADGNLPSGAWSHFTFSALNVATVSFDNAKLFYKPFKANVDLLANGEVVATKTGVDTAGVLVSELVSGVKVKGYAVTGVKLGTETYGLEDTIKVPCDCQLELALEEQATNPATPTTNEEKSMRVGGDPSGIRFKAELTKTDMAETTEYGWIVTREALLTEAGIAAADFTLDSTVKMSKGWNYGNGVETAKIFEQDDEFAWFTAILYFSATEDDGLPSVDKIAGKLVARPFAKNGEDYLYGEPTAPTSMFDIALKIYNDVDAYNELDGDAQVYIEDLLYKADEDENNIPDILE